ncbi:hypothetical protein [Psychromicrobium sp. YIM B11713]|uniref:hypothetical protein n=1 Tax=Psychromicrobium sp. YIM B11713 TaxID=3145233 RepID=UPI00374EC0AF
MTQTQPEPSAIWWRLLNLVALLLAVLGFGVLSYLVAVRLSGGESWPVLNWIVMYSLPAAFILLGLSIIHAIRRRRRL